MKSEALIPQLIQSRDNSLGLNILSILAGTFLLSVLAQIAIPLPWTPVPITGQTFGVAFLALTWGAPRALASFASYLFLGGLGLPVFAFMGSTLALGPTMGYLVGMLIASFVVGYLSDIGFANTFIKRLLSAYVGSVIIFGLGCLVLSYFIPQNTNVFALGVVPFLIGDFIKNSLAAFFATGVKSLYDRN